METLHNPNPSDVLAATRSPRPARGLAACRWGLGACARRSPSDGLSQEVEWSGVEWSGVEWSAALTHSFRAPRRRRSRRRRRDAGSRFTFGSPRRSLSAASRPASSCGSSTRRVRRVVAVAVVVAVVSERRRRRTTTTTRRGIDADPHTPSPRDAPYSPSWSSRLVVVDETIRRRAALLEEMTTPSYDHRRAACVRIGISRRDDRA